MDALVRREVEKRLESAVKQQLQGTINSLTEQSKKLREEMEELQKGADGAVTTEEAIKELVNAELDKSPPLPVHAGTETNHGMPPPGYTSVAHFVNDKMTTDLVTR